jgi:iron only hydrogenase large subunit-like protein
LPPPPPGARAGEPLPRLEVEAVRGLQGIKQARLVLPGGAPGGMAGRELRVAVASGIGNARHLLQRMHRGEAPHYDFVEVRGLLRGGGGARGAGCRLWPGP